MHELVGACAPAKAVQCWIKELVGTIKIVMPACLLSG